MKPLKRGFEASKETVSVWFNGKEYEVANLLKGGILKQTSVLVAVEDEWKEANVINLGANDSDLQDFKTFVESHNLTLMDLGIEISAKQEAAQKDYNLKHDDFMQLEKEFPSYSYIKIAGLDKHLKNTGQKSGMYSMRQTLRYITDKNWTISEYIENEAQQAQEIINNSKPKIIDMTKKQDLAERFNQRIELLQSLGFSWNDQFQNYVRMYGTPEAPASFFVSQNSVDNDAEETWSATLDRIYTALGIERPKPIEEYAPEPEVEAVEAEIIQPEPAEGKESGTPSKKPVSLQTIGALTPDRISELIGLKEKQELIAKENPVIEITDKKTYDQAKKNAAALLKASTAIDGSTGIDAHATKYLNQFKKMLKSALDPLAKITRTPYDKQKVIIGAWESKEELRIAAENRAKLEKIQARTNLLFQTGFVLNGVNYVLGTIYVLPSNIESMEDSEFDKIIESGKTAKIEIDKAASAESDKDREIRELKERLAALTGDSPADVTAHVVGGEKVSPAPERKPTEITSESAAATGTGTAVKPTPTTTVTDSSGATMKYPYGTTYVMPAPENEILSKLDAENMTVLENPNYIKCREFYKRGMAETALAIRTIFASASTTKAQDIKDLLTIIENQK